VDTNTVCCELYDCGRNRPIRSGKIVETGLLVVNTYEGPSPGRDAEIDR
jgi:hypothetical protein